MDLFLNLRVGIWNAWTLMLFIPLQPLIMKAIENLAGAGSILQRMGEQSANPRERNLNLVYLAIEGLLFVSPSFFRCALERSGFFGGGLGLYVIGLVLFWGSVTWSQRPPKINLSFPVCTGSQGIRAAFPRLSFSWECQWHQLPGSF